MRQQLVLQVMLRLLLLLLPILMPFLLQVATPPPISGGGSRDAEAFLER